MENPNQLPRILIVDESRMVRAMISKHIREFYDFREEANGGFRAAPRRFAHHPPQIRIVPVEIDLIDDAARCIDQLG